MKTLSLLLLSSLCFAGEIQHVDVIKGNPVDPGTFITILNNGGQLDYHDTILPGMSFSKHRYTPDSPLIVDGHGTSIMYAFKGAYQEYDPANPPERIWGGLSIMDSENIIVRGWKIEGGVENTANLNDSYPETNQVKNITLEDCEVWYAETRGLFVGGSKISNLHFIRCRFRECIYSGNCTHGAYVSGGSWNPIYPPITGIDFEDCIFALTGGRHGLQFNGRFRGVKINGCRFFFNQLCGISLIGCRNVEVTNCLFFGNGRAPIVIYDDPFDSSYWDPDFHLEEGQDIMAKGPKGRYSFENWVLTHHPNGKIHVSGCTLITGPTQWEKDQWHDNNPLYFPCIQINNAVDGQLFGGQIMHYPPGMILLDHNTFIAPRGCMIQFSHMHDAIATRVFANTFYALDKEVPYISIGQVNSNPVNYQIPFVEADANGANWYWMNSFSDPKIPMPVYPCIDRTKQPNYDFSTMWEIGDAYMANVKGKVK